MTKIQKSLEDIVEEIETQVAFAWKWAKRISITVVVLAAVFVLSHLALYYVCQSSGRPVCDPTFAYLRLNEWGDYFAGFGATIAFIFVGTGLFVQMKELELQRLEMKEARIEQTKATSALAKTAENDVTLALFADINHQLELLPKLTVEGQINKPSNIPGKRKLIFTLSNPGSTDLVVTTAILKPEDIKAGADGCIDDRTQNCAASQSITVYFDVPEKFAERIMNESTLTLTVTDQYPAMRLLKVDIRSELTASNIFTVSGQAGLVNQRTHLHQRLLRQSNNS